MKLRIILLTLLLTNLTFAQNLEKIGKKDMVTVGGGLNYNTVYNQVVGQEQFRDPFTWMLSGNVSINILDVALPFTFSFTNAASSYTQPFNMTAIHPKYKKWQAHLGITSMSFSPYTYQGMNFTGAGLEYSPKKWKFKAFGGRLKKEIEYDSEADNINAVSYRRWGFGFSSKFEGKILGSELIIFKAYDDPKSLQFPVDNPDVRAQDNLVTSFSSSLRILNGLEIKGEISNSLLTRDVLLTDPAYKRTFLDDFVNGNQTTVATQAYNGSINYRMKWLGLGAKYERINPEYKTLGAMYFNNDIENITFNPSFSVLKGRVNLNLSAGFQRNNLNDRNANNSTRWIGNANLSAQIIKGLSLSLSYSNMSSFTKRNPMADPFYDAFGDTLNYYQISENYTGALAYAFGDSIQNSFSLTGMHSKSNNITGRLEDAAAFGMNVSTDENSTPVHVYNGVFSHRISIKRTKTSIGWSVNANLSEAMNNENAFLGPGLNFSQAIKKINITTAVVYNKQFTNNTLTNNVMNYRAGCSYAPQWWDKKYGSLSMSVNGTYTDRMPTANNKSVQNLTIIANLAYQFK